MKKRYLGESLVPYLFIAPFMISFIIFFLVPAAYSFILSFFQYKGYGSMKFIGAKNYTSLFTYGSFWLSLRNTFFYFIVHSIPTIIIAFILAYMLQSKLMYGVQRYYKPVLFLPQVIPIVASALVWKIILSRDTGVINQIFGLTIDYLNDPAWQRWMVVVLQIWRATGWYMIIFLAGLTTVGEELHDASLIDGASTMQHIVRIVLPIMKPIFLFTFIMNGIGAIKLFTEPTVLIAVGSEFKPNVMTLMNVLVSNINGANFGMASATGWFVFVLVLIVTLIWFKVLGRRED
jgi:ABC-type sugar transport system permease subunit